MVKVVILVMVVAAVAGVARAVLPDVRRYLRMRRM